MVDGALSHFADRLNELLPEVMRGFLRREANALSKCNITLPQFLVMNYLHNEGEATMTAVAHFLNVTTAAATGVVERMVKGDYVKRIYDSADRRIIRIDLTPRGTAQVKKFNLQKRQFIIDIFGKMTEEDRSQYLRIITRIRQILQEEHLPEKK
jgi:DNA-binding MarR family transcriptional regulator